MVYRTLPGWNAGNSGLWLTHEGASGVPIDAEVRHRRLKDSGTEAHCMGQRSGPGTTIAPGIR